MLCSVSAAILAAGVLSLTTECQRATRDPIIPTCKATITLSAQSSIYLHKLRRYLVVVEGMAKSAQMSRPTRPNTLSGKEV